MAMKRFTGGGTNEQEARELIRAHRNGGEAPLGPSFEDVAGARTLSRRQAIGLLGGSLVGVSLLSLGLAEPAKACHIVAIRGPGADCRPTLSGVRKGNWWELTVEWWCNSSPEAANHTFQTNWTLMEHDLTSGHDVISATVEPHLHSAHSPVKTFIPSQANPSNPREVIFRETIIWHRDDLDTELGAEELFARVRLRDVTANSRVWNNDTYDLDIAP